MAGEPSHWWDGAGERTEHTQMDVPSGDAMVLACDFKLVQMDGLKGVEALQVFYLCCRNGR